MLVSSRVAEIVNAPSINAEGRESFFAYYQLRKDLPFRKLEVNDYHHGRSDTILLINLGTPLYIILAQRGS
jgi:hypothetical protein